ncbi:MAG: sn-glycerol-3-phosphate ABC transporter ATP-binding protein UgpC [Burkholderiales bacterium]|nr:sn-glycerol-3-phosphate ABC transporter ATP-binding protein UgpC [Burkholderiales bacterium]
MSAIQLRHISKSFNDTEIIRDVSVDIADGEFCVLVGPSGSGKSTLLRLIAGLEAPNEGSIHIGERDVTEEPPKRRDIAMVFQSYALYPQMTVRDNMGFSLHLAGMERKAARAKVDTAAQMLGLTALLDRYPRELSGGQRQRVAMGRAIVREPAVFLFDEPLSNLDAALRAQVRREIVELHRRLRSTAVYVTHDQVEAMSMGDRIVVLRAGRVEQTGTPQELYQQPANRFVAGFIGSPAMNLIEGDLLHESDRVNFVAAGQGPVSLPLRADGQGKATLGLRPEHLQLLPAEGETPSDGLVIQGEVVDTEFSGADTLVLLDTPLGRLSALADDRSPWRRGDCARLHASTDRLHLFDAQGERLISHG